MRRSEKVTQKREVAARLREIRKNTGLTQEKFSEMLELSLSAYKKVESAENQISIDSLRKLEQQLKVSADYILFGKQENVDEMWKLLLNCSERDKMFLLLRLINYFTRVKERQYPIQETEAVYDEKVLDLLKEVDI